MAERQAGSRAEGSGTHPSTHLMSCRTLMLSVVTSTPGTRCTTAVTAAVVLAAVSHASLTCSRQGGGRGWRCISLPVSRRAGGARVCGCCFPLAGAEPAHRGLGDLDAEEDLGHVGAHTHGGRAGHRQAAGLQGRERRVLLVRRAAASGGERAAAAAAGCRAPSQLACSARHAARSVPGPGSGTGLPGQPGEPGGRKARRRDSPCPRPKLPGPWRRLQVMPLRRGGARAPSWLLPDRGAAFGPRGWLVCGALGGLRGAKQPDQNRSNQPRRGACPQLVAAVAVPLPTGSPHPAGPRLPPALKASHAGAHKICQMQINRNIRHSGLLGLAGGRSWKDTLGVPSENQNKINKESGIKGPRHCCAVSTATRYGNTAIR